MVKILTFTTQTRNEMVLRVNFKTAIAKAHRVIFIQITTVSLPLSIGGYFCRSDSNLDVKLPTQRKDYSHPNRLLSALTAGRTH